MQSESVITKENYLRELGLLGRVVYVASTDNYRTSRSDTRVTVGK